MQRPKADSDLPKYFVIWWRRLISSPIFFWVWLWSFMNLRHKFERLLISHKFFLNFKSIQYQLWKLPSFKVNHYPPICFFKPQCHAKFGLVLQGCSNHGPFKGWWSIDVGMRRCSQCQIFRTHRNAKLGESSIYPWTFLWFSRNSLYSRTISVQFFHQTKVGPTGTFVISHQVISLSLLWQIEST